MKYLVEEVFKTEGVPEYTFVAPPNYNEILIDVRNPTKPVIIEGQSGTGKTVTILKMLEKHLGRMNFEYLTARKSQDITKIHEIADNIIRGNFIIDDFHRLEPIIQEKIGNIIKVAAEEGDPSKNPKIIIIGINKVGSGLINLVHDIAKRVGIHKIKPGTKNEIIKLIQSGEEKLNISFSNKDIIFNESSGDYWLTQLICQSACLNNNIIETQEYKKDCEINIEQIRTSVTDRLKHAYLEPVVEFCRGKRFRSTNDPYFKLLRAIAQQENSIVDIAELANANPDIRGSINNIKERRLSVLLEGKPICERYFYYNNKTKYFAIEDPALFYYLKNLDWINLRHRCGFRDYEKDFDFDFALSFAGENRELAKIIATQLEIMDCSIFFDELFEANFLGKVWSANFKEIFAEKARFVVCILDKYHLEKIWPTFERECFKPRVNEEAVIPIYLDDSKFPGIPDDIVGIDLRNKQIELTEDFVTDNIVFKLLERLENI